MASAAPECCACKKPITGSAKGFQLSTGEFYHEACYVCERCSDSLLPQELKRPRVLFKSDGSPERVCRACQLKDPVWGPIIAAGPSPSGTPTSSSASGGTGGPPTSAPPAFTSELSCDTCGKMILGAALKTSGGKTIHPSCDDRRCHKCRTFIMGKPHGIVGASIWCEDCINKRGKSTLKDQVDGRHITEERIRAGREGLHKPGAGGGTTTFHMIRMCDGCRTAIHGSVPIQVGSKVFHKKCLKCERCALSVDPKSPTMTVRGDSLFCGRPECS